MSESEELLRQLAAAHYPQPHETRDPLARAIAKTLCLLCAVLLAAVLIWLQQNINWQFIGQ